ncbi:MAG: zf-HC2 domain-containing protein [Chloroherpetonaceae bacterium]|nr:zf-HC2 domain-containing protein [Chthonomonadaceae bacterium]MDW8208884.1 zf-HC2 domain-containing protein [Chloroherpetonaceae bacterium]
MNCRYVQQRLSAYIDGELSGFEHRIVRQHLSGCPECAAEHQGLLTTKRLISSLRAHEPPRELPERIFSAIAAEEAALARNRSASVWERFFRPLRETLPSPRLMLSGAVAGVALAFVLAHTIAPHEDDRMEWSRPVAAQTSVLPSSPFPAPTDSFLFRNEPTTAGIAIGPSALPSRYGYTPAQYMSASLLSSQPYASPHLYEGVDLRRGWYRTH